MLMVLVRLWGNKTLKKHWSSPSGSIEICTRRVSSGITKSIIGFLFVPFMNRHSASLGVEKILKHIFLLCHLQVGESRNVLPFLLKLVCTKTLLALHLQTYSTFIDCAIHIHHLGNPRLPKQLLLLSRERASNRKLRPLLSHSWAEWINCVIFCLVHDFTRSLIAQLIFLLRFQILKFNGQFLLDFKTFMSDSREWSTQRGLFSSESGYVWLKVQVWGLFEELAHAIIGGWMDKLVLEWRTRSKSLQMWSPAVAVWGRQM